MFCASIPGTLLGAELLPLPAPEPLPEVSESIAATLATLPTQIDELRAAAARPKAEHRGDSLKPNKLSPHGKPTLALGGVRARAANGHHRFRMAIGFGDTTKSTAQEPNAGARCPSGTT